MELNGAKILYTIHTDIPLLGDFKITQTLVSTWIVMALLSGFAIWLGRNLKLENVSKRQAAAEFIVERLDQFVHDNMGYHFDKYIPLIGAIFALSIGCNLNGDKYIPCTYKVVNSSFPAPAGFPFS